ncbi:Heavy metal transport/detoxification protein [Thermovirga lienii DSM 17291]|jgi:copper chaperone|uniref:Heavy metal transport/detoxification protein n=1 Tax=Thermovirga lienii (strain ATCC BAA-1197 / DSM 17291 / Cas60314) TaxID=580340 RepID=G7V6H5_THELD|nr:heavy-metal-associated domain-containing protein [Thermovirga lienii]AER67088.1 Heavy metal transport/detoxification protein [Thermovirga lienii DSM 17291]KUK43134.1 MAG: Heavy metal transport/detoxification protein [Thermovirga lienii]MDN5318801.1 copper chaperone [Thermovirga sp.]MDN5368571.1 copper chaperone [Thermovirga sp.]
MTKTVFVVPDMSCEHCVRRITQVLSDAGYGDVEVLLSEKLVKVSTDKPEEVMEILEDAGYPASIKG